MKKILTFIFCVFAFSANTVEKETTFNKELFDNVCLIAKLSDPKSLAEKIEEGLTDYPENLIKNGLEKVTKFGSREAEMKKLLRLYQQ